ncbi:MAG: hypothetical protein HY722_10765 [Planctomycetes bacterium]|nr:hypothetical protein [Planctomycetota bacterium]
MGARDFGLPEDPAAIADEEVAPYRGLSPGERYARFLDLMRLMERIWHSLDPERRRRCERALEALDDAGRWWERAGPDAGRG